MAALETDAISGAAIGTEQTVGAYTVAAGISKVSIRVYLELLVASQQTLTLRVTNTPNGESAATCAYYSTAKHTAASTAFILLCDGIDVETSDVLTVYVTSSVADTVDGHTKFFDDFGGIGAPVSLDSGVATLAGMLTKMADDNGGADFDAGTDSLEKIQTSVAAGFPQNINADVEPGGGVITTGTNTANDGDSTWANDGTYWQVAATTAVGGFGLNMHQVFTLGTSIKPSILRVNAKENLAGLVHVWLYDYDAAAWEQVSDADTAISGNSDNDYTYIINSRHQQASDGEVQVRYTSTSEETNKYLYLDFVVIQAVAISELTAAEIAQAVWEADLAVVHGAFPASAGHILQDTFAIVTTVGTGDTTTSFTLTAGQAANDCYNGMVITIEDATDSHYESRRIVDYTSGRVVTVDRAFSFTPAAGDHAEIVNIAYADVNVTHLAASAIQQASGYIKVSTGTGTGQIDLDTGGVKIFGLADASAAKLDDILDGTGGTGLKMSTLEVTSTTTLTGAVALGSTLGVAGATTLASLGVTAALTTGSITNNGTLTQTGAVTLSSTLATGAVTLSGLAITNALSVGTTTTLTGAVSLASTLGVAGATTFTGAVTCTNGIVSDITGDITGGITGNITGNLSGSVASVSGAVGSVTGAVGSVGTGGIANATFAADVGTTVYASNRIALAVSKTVIENNLDHLMKTAVNSNSDMSTEVPDGTVISNILSATSDTSTYVVSTDSLEAMSVVLATVTTTANEQHNIETRTEVVDGE